MLMVILGAGASYDSVSHSLPPGKPRLDSKSVRPPLANQLFEDRPMFVRVMDNYKDCKPVISRLRGVNVEQALARLLEEAPTYPVRYRQLIAIRYYLQSIRVLPLSKGLRQHCCWHLMPTLSVWRDSSGASVSTGFVTRIGGNTKNGLDASCHE